jgi:DNA-directed RNA polymerase subunit K/omega
MPTGSPKAIAFKEIESGCFEVTSHKANSWGYPAKRIDNKQTRLSRHIWQECFGEIPDGMFVLHHCDNRMCINPEHLFIGTQMDNMHDMISKGRQGDSRNHNPKSGESNGSSKLTEQAVREIRKRHIAGDRRNGTHALAREFNVKLGTICFVVQRKTWKGVS